MDLSLSSGASAAFLRGVEGSIEIFLQRGELTRKVSPTVFWGLSLARENSGKISCPGPRKTERDVVDSVAIRRR